MSFWLKMLFAIACLGTFPSVYCPCYAYKKLPVYNTTQLVNLLNQTVAQVSPNDKIGIQIKSMRSGNVLYHYNDQESLTPASILKILTAEAALLYLGSDYKFLTQFATLGNISPDGTLNGDIYLIHSGDPTLTYYNITDLFVTLKAQQLQKITGNIYIDNTAYDQDNFGPGWAWNDTRYCYSAPINASIINHNCIAFKITPGKKIGQHATIITSPRYYYSTIQNSIVTKSHWSHSCYVHLNPNKDNSITISGCLPRGRYSRTANVVIANILQYNKSMLYNLLHRFKIFVKGKFDFKNMPSLHFIPLAQHESKPLHLMINDMLKKSDNVIASSLFKKLGNLYMNQPGSWQNGSAAVTYILGHHLPFNTQHLTLIDGSGLSQYNKLTAEQMMQVLDFGFHNPNIRYDLISALPVAGVDGTLKHRLHNVAWKVRAKTGTLQGVTSLAGYAISLNKEPLAFVIMINGRNDAWKYRKLEDKIATALTRYKE